MATPGSSRKSVSDSETGSSSRQSTGGTIPDALSVEEHGRHWNAYREGKYLLPNDGDEQDRLDMQHKMWRMRLGGRLHLAPVQNSAHVLDIGTGTGIWALQFAAENPQSDVIGTDISMIQPTENLPPNCNFIREDSEEEWIFGKMFTYIHWRLMVSAFQDHRVMIQKVYDNLLPDGWAEFHEWSCEFIGENPAAEEELRASALGQLAPRLLAGGARTGRNFQAPRNYKRWMLEMGFVDVTEVQVLTPVNGWPIDPHDRMMGSWACLDLLKLVRATTKILHAGGIPLEDIPLFQDQVCQCLTQRSMRVYSPSYIVYGRKPVPQPSSSASPLQERPQQPW